MPAPTRMILPRSVPALLVLAVLGAGSLAGQETPALLDRTLTAARPRPFEALSRTILNGRDKLVAAAPRDSVVEAVRSQLGLRYRLGALAPGRAFDCSGLVKWVMGLFEIELPRTAALQARTGIELPKDPRQVRSTLIFRVLQTRPTR